MGEAIETTQYLYPHLLDTKPDLLFMLKCRQFVEMVNGTDSEVRGGNSSYHSIGTGIVHSRSPKSYLSDGSSRSSPAQSPHPYSRAGTPPSQQHQYSVHYSQQQTFNQQSHQSHHNRGSGGSACNSPSRSSGKSQGRQSPGSVSTAHHNSQHHYHNSSYNNSSDNGNSMQNNHPLNCGHIGEAEALLNSANAIAVGDHSSMNGGPVGSRLIDTEEMELSDEGDHASPQSNGNSHINGNSIHDDEEMDVDVPSHRRQMCGGNEAAIEKMLSFGRELKMMSQRLRKEFGKNEANKKALQDAFSLLAYSDPWNSPIGSQLLPVKREPVCAALNSAILESKGLPKQPPLELTIGQVTQCMRLMSKSGIGACAFASVSDYLH
ncbi:unnamed protein product [Lymnaea stagnalis]|uniref:CTLH domain-containing protein n=1 Tax=Lymnaea stagnalis TaxID=6523 RepID=A0AAV2HLZ9_LYMST